jgi:hypothetical protein
LGQSSAENADTKVSPLPATKSICTIQSAKKEKRFGPLHPQSSQDQKAEFHADTMKKLLSLDIKRHLASSSYLSAIYPA